MVAVALVSAAAGEDGTAPTRPGPESDRAATIREQGMEHMRNGELGLAYESFAAAQRIYEDIGDVAASAVLLNDMGKIQTDLSQYPTAADHLLRALQRFESIGDANSQMVVLNRLGVLHLELAELDNALDYFTRALILAEGAGDSKKIASLLGNIGIVHARRGEHQQAIDCYTRSLNTGEASHSPRAVAIYHNNIGVEYARQGDYRRALGHYLKSISLLEEEGDQQLLGEGYNNAGECFLKLGRLQEAEESILKALRMAESSGEKVTQQDCYLNLTSLYEARRDFRAALKAHRRYAELRDEIFSAHKAEQIAELQTRFDSEQKADEIKQLRYEAELQSLQLRSFHRTRLLLLLSVGLAVVILAIVVVGYRRKISAQRLLREKNAQLDHFAREAWRSDKLRRELVSNVSHDLRSPLAVVHGYIETLLLKDDELTPRQRRRYLRIALSGSDRLERLVSDLFDLSRLEARQVVVEREPFSLNDLVNDSAHQYELLAKTRGVDLQFEIDTDAPMVEADVALMERVLQNLLSNAVKYTPQGGWIRVRVAPVAEGVEVALTNSGPGIPAEKVPLLFDRYYSSGEGGSAEGSGLGLAIVSKILNLHEIEMRVLGEAGEYVSFSFCVPYAVADGTGQGSAAAATGAPSRRVSPSHGQVVVQEQVPGTSV